MSIERYFASLTERLHSSAHVRTVYGEPVEAAGKTIIPVSKIRYAFGAGPTKVGDDGVASTAGAGGAVQADAIGVFEVTEARAQFVPVEHDMAVAGALAVGFLAGVLIGLWGASR